MWQSCGGNHQDVEVYLLNPETYKITRGKSPRTGAMTVKQSGITAALFAIDLHFARRAARAEANVLPAAFNRTPTQMHWGRRRAARGKRRQ